MGIIYRQYSLVKEYSWEQVLGLGVDPTLYKIECWLLTQAIDPLITEKLGFEKSDISFNLWRSLLLKEILDLNSYDETERMIADSLSMRCFIRIYSLAKKPPTKKNLGSVYRAKKDILDNAFYYLATLWYGCDKIRIESRPRWQKVMDDFAKRQIDKQQTKATELKNQKLNCTASSKQI